RRHRRRQWSRSPPPPGRRPGPRHAPATGPPPPAATAAAARSDAATAPPTSTPAGRADRTRSPYQNIKHQTKTHHVISLQSHYAANLMAATPKSAWGWVRALLHSVYDQPDAASVHAQFGRVLDALEDKLPQVAAHLDAARADILAFTAFPKAIWRQIWSNNP